MKRIIIVILMLLTSCCFSQGSFTIGNNKFLKDSSDKIISTFPFWFQSTTYEFGNGSNATLNFKGSPSLDEALLFQLNGTNILEFSNDTPHWDFKYPISLNGVPFTTGGGDAYLTARQTFTKRNIFSDTLKADALSLMEQVRIADWFQITGDIISDLQFIKGSRVRIGTADNYGIVFKTADTNRLSIDSLGNVTIYKNLELLGGITVTNDIATLGDVTANNLNGQLSAGSITSGTLDTARIPNTAKIDTANFAHTTIGTTESFLSNILFSALVTFQTTSPVFNIAAVFNVLQNFANGISTTTMTASGNVSVSGYTSLGDSIGGIAIKYCEVKGKIGSGTNQQYNFPLPTHLLGNGFKRIVTWQANVRNDSAVGGGKKNIAPGSWFGNSVYYASIDSGICAVSLGATTNAVNDSVFFSIWYRSNGTAND